MKKPMLILIGGSPWVGKTTCANRLYDMLDGCAWLDGDDVWRVNPFSLDDPRLRNGDKNIAFVLQTYLQSGFKYVILSSVVITIPEIRKRIIEMIDFKNYESTVFILQADKKNLRKRCKTRNQINIMDYQWADMSFHDHEIQIDTSGKKPAEVAKKIKNLIEKRREIL